MILTPDILKERKFQSVIKEYLINENGYEEGTNSGYNHNYAIDEEQLFSFLEETQEKALGRLKEIYKGKYKEKILYRLDHELKTRSIIDVLRHGIKDYGVKLDLAYFKPPTTLNQELVELYQKNILSVTEELTHKEGERIDLVIFLNGLPVLAFELKNEFTGQNVDDAKLQWMHERSGTDQLFRFKQRVIAIFAMDTSEAYMATRLNGTKTFFLPFNKGNNSGKGNPIVEGKLKTHYVWEDVLIKDNLLEILGKFVYLQVEEDMDDDGNIRKKETMIFPRYHQRDAVRKLVDHSKKHGSGESYLIQHSAGSGKTNSISWLSHRLATLHNENNQAIFDGVIVVTDRKVLDKQLQKAVYQLEHKAGMVSKIEDDSSQLAESLDRGIKIIITTIQKFRFILDKIGTLKDKNYAIIIDEAHSSTSGKNMAALTTSLTLEEAQRLDEEQEEQTPDTEDKIIDEVRRIGKQKNISFYAFTATPKGSTLKMFGTEDERGVPKPFHVYSMKQAIEEKFIMDVLKNYVSYKTYYKIAKKIEDDPEFESAKATKAISRFVSLHPHNIEQKTEIMLEHFRKVTSKKVNGQAKAMVVTASRLHAVRYKLAFDEYIRKKGYQNLKALVAFSGTVKDKGEDYKEVDMNDGLAEKQLPKKFDSDEYQILLVAEKYQTGFDQPKLHTMFVDKKLNGLKAVQTLSRLNRTHPDKEDTFILDFVNDPEEIRNAFETYYEDAVLVGDIDPNELYSIQQELESHMVLQQDDIEKFVDIIYKEKQTKRDVELSNNYIDSALERYRELVEEEQRDFVAKAKKFNSIYMFVLQITPFEDVELHKLFIYLRYLLKKISVKRSTKVNLDDKIVLEYYSIQNKGKANISLGNDGEEHSVSISISGGRANDENPKDPLTVIIDRLNTKYGTNFSKHERLNLQQMVNIASSDEVLISQAKNNPLEDFKLGFKKKFDNIVIEGYEKDQGFYGKVLEDELYSIALREMLAEYVYQQLNK